MLTKEEVVSTIQTSLDNNFKPSDFDFGDHQWKHENKVVHGFDLEQYNFIYYCCEKCKSDGMINGEKKFFSDHVSCAQVVMSKAFGEDVDKG